MKATTARERVEIGRDDKRGRIHCPGDAYHQLYLPVLRLP
jgi:hypothetical protein